MPDLSGFFAAVEKALFEVATWVFLIPKTLYLVLSHPGKVPEYVRGELSPGEEGRTRFHGTVSPLLLFLLVTLGPFLLVQLVQVPKAPIEGEPTGFVGSESDFRANFEEIPWAQWMKITWSIELVHPDGWVEVWEAAENCFRGWERIDECDVAESASAGEADPEPGTSFDDALEAFVTLVDDGASADEAKQGVADQFGPSDAQEVYDYWCSPPPGPGCDPAYDQFFVLLELGNSADEARQLVAERFGDHEAREIYDYWCSPPPGPGCYPASDRFAELLAEGLTEEQALAGIAREFGADEVEALLSRYEAEIRMADMAPAGPAAIPGLDSPESAGFFLGDTLTWPWEQPGLYRVSFEVRDMQRDELIDQSEVHEIVVKVPPTAAGATERDPKEKDRRSPAAEAKVQDEEPRELRERPAGQGEKKAGDKINDFFQSFETAGLALAFLMFPLVLTLATELHRHRPITQSTIKPAFYAQCLYLSPFVVSIWIPVLLWQYHPEPAEEYGYALILAAVIFVWLVIAEVGFVRRERSVSRFRAVLWLAVPVGFVVASLFAVALVAVQHKYAIVEWVGNTVMVLMLIPFIASGLVRLWRWITRRKVERPFHGGEW